MKKRKKEDWETKKIKGKEEKKWLSKDGKLLVDIFQTEEEIVIQSVIAGVDKEELEIITEKDVVIIKGERKRPQEEIKEFYSKECYWGPFSREIILPEETDPTRAKATMEKGILIIKVPKIEKEKKRKIELDE